MIAFNFAVSTGTGVTGSPWLRTPHYQSGLIENKLNQHPEDEHRTTEEILQDCRELEAAIEPLELEILTMFARLGR